MIRESTENYLETILVLSQRLAAVRSIDISNELGYSKPTISITMKNLREMGYVLVDDNGYITLTDSGRAIAEQIYERHTILTRMLMALGVSRETAVADACKIEHDLSQETFDRIKDHLERMEK